MAMIKCPECGKQISDKAASCPNCGYPLESFDLISANYKLAKNALSARSYALAADYCDKAIAISPDNFLALTLKAVIILKTGGSPKTAGIYRDQARNIQREATVKSDAKVMNEYEELSDLYMNTLANRSTSDIDDLNNYLDKIIRGF